MTTPSDEKKDRAFIYDQCLETTQQILSLIYGSRKSFINAQNIHPLESIIIYSYDQIVDLPNAAKNAAQMIGIQIPLSDDCDIALYEQLKEHLLIANKNNIDLSKIIGLSKAEYLGIPESKKAPYCTRTTYYLKNLINK